MEQKQVQVHECCVVPYRLTATGVEFCLVTPTATNRWEFPKIGLERADAPQPALLDQAASRVGLDGSVQASQPLGDFIASRAGEQRSMIGYLMEVTGVEDAWPQQSNNKRLWCLPEEARVRIRRKPLRRFIDLALRAIDSRSGANGHAAAQSA